MPAEQVADERISSLRIGWSCVASGSAPLRQYVIGCMQIA
jgi:hypothetical protein